MSPHPSITAPPQPLLPRQTVDPSDPYGISSMLASISDLYSEYSISSYSYDSAYYSSLMSEYESLTAGYSLTDYSIPTIAPTAAGTRTTGGGAPTATSVPPSAAESSTSSEHKGMSSGAKIGIGVGVALGLLLLAGIGICIWCMGKRKGKKTTTTIVAPSQPAFGASQQQQPPPQSNQPFQQPQPQMGYVNNQGYMQGVPQQGYQQQPYPPQTISPPPQYVQPPSPEQHGMAGAYSAYAKGTEPNVAELEHEYHFAKPGVVEMDGSPEPQDARKK
jgi:hypothetical protein